MRTLFAAACACFLLNVLPASAADAPLSAREALKPFNDFVGKWRGTGEPEGTRAEKLKGFWTESINWEWGFKGDDAWVQMESGDGKYLMQGELRWVPEKKAYRFEVLTPEKEKLVFEGTFENKRLTLDREDPEKKETQRLVFSLLHSNRYLYRYEVRKAGSTSFSKQYQVGVTSTAQPFASGDGYPECIVSGGRGTTMVSFKGKTYYVCCSGCRDEFNANPEKYIAEFEAKQKQKK